MFDPERRGPALRALAHTGFLDQLPKMEAEFQLGADKLHAEGGADGYLSRATALGADVVEFEEYV